MKKISLLFLVLTLFLTACDSRDVEQTNKSDETKQETTTEENVESEELTTQEDTDVNEEETHDNSEQVDKIPVDLEAIMQLDNLENINISDIENYEIANYDCQYTVYDNIVANNTYKAIENRIIYLKTHQEQNYVTAGFTDQMIQNSKDKAETEKDFTLEEDGYYYRVEFDGDMMIEDTEIDYTIVDWEKIYQTESFDDQEDSSDFYYLELGAILNSIYQNNGTCVTY